MLSERIRVWVQRFPDRQSLVLQWHDPETGKRKSRSAGTANEKDAEQKARDLEYELSHGTYQEPARMTWEQFTELYAAEKLSGLRPNTRAKAGWVFESFGERARPKNLGAVNERLISQYAAKLRSEKRTPATIQGHLAYLKAALKWAVEQKLLPVMPKIGMPKVPKTLTIRKITGDEFARLLGHAPDDAWAAFLSTAWYTGMRRNEMLDLVWESDSGKPWIDFAANRVRIPAAYNKSDADQWIPLHPDLGSLLKARRQTAGPLFVLGSSPPNVSHKFTRVAKAAGLRITLHDLRRSFGSRYASAVPAPVLKRLMRHADIKTTLTFYTDVDDVLDEAIRKA